MKTLLLLSLLLSSLIFSEVQGIRLEKGFSSAAHLKLHEAAAASPIKITSNGCGNGHCSSGKNRKLMTKTTSSPPPPTTSPTTNSKNVKNGGKLGDQESFRVNASPVSEHREAAPESYPDIIDIAGMDYSPARRKPPIHN